MRRTNKEIMGISYCVIILFVCVAGYLGYFLYHDADYYRNSSYNAKRLQQLETRFVRGEIRASDGTTLASTVTSDDGTETRTYPYGKIFAHVVGYSYKGVTGLESSAASYLLNSHTNPVLRIIENLQGSKTSGDNVITTLDVNLQQTAYSELSDYDGAIVVMEPDTGRVLAEVSRPGFDPNTIADDWDSLVEDDSNSSLVNRATQGLYTPGSTFKILTALEYMSEFPSSWSDYQFDCNGSYTVDDNTIHCAHDEEHGKEDITRAFAESCNCAFADIGLQLSFPRFHQLAEQIGFNSAPDIRVPTAASKFVLDNNNSTWKIMQTSIGQGETQITPMFNCMVTSAVANGGIMMNPYLIESVESKYGDKVASFGPQQYRQIMTADQAAQIRDMMRKVVTDGTGTEAGSSSYTAYGKTGSAETSSDGSTNAWFVGWAEDKDSGRKVAVSIVVEEGGSGGSIAGPIAKKIFKAYFNEG